VRGPADLKPSTGAGSTLHDGRLRPAGLYRCAADDTKLARYRQEAIVSEPIEATISEALREVYDPCCKDKGISVVDVGLLHHAELDGTASEPSTDDWIRPPWGMPLCQMPL